MSEIVPLTLAEANEFIASFHRHNKPVVGHRFCIGAMDSGELVGVAIVGRPVARQIDQWRIAEVTRTCTNEKAPKGTVSKLYAACWRAWRAMGGLKLITYTLQSESGASLRGAGWKCIGEVKLVDNPWGSHRRSREWQPIFGQQKLKWETTAAAAAAGATPPVQPAAKPAEAAKPAAAAKPEDKPAEKPAEKPHKDKKITSEKFKAFVGRMVGVETEKKPATKPKEPKPTEKKPESKPEGETPPPKPEGRPRATPKPAAPSAPKGMTAEEIAELSARTAAETAARMATKPATETPPTPAERIEKLNADDKQTYRILRQMEKQMPTRYAKGFADKWLTENEATAKYAQDWEKAHPGEEFDITSPEHADWVAAHDTPWEDGDYQTAQTEMLVEARLESHNRKVNEQLSELDRRQKITDAAPIMAQHRTTAAMSFWKELGGDYADIIKPDGTVNTAKIDALYRKDDQGKVVGWKNPTDALRFSAAQALADEAPVIYQFMEGLLPKLDENNPVHAAFNDFGYRMERQMLAQKPEEQVDAQGRAFKPLSEYHALPKDQQAKFWTFTTDMLIKMRADDLAQHVKKKLQAEEENFRAMAAARGIQIPDNPPPAAKPGQANGELPPEENEDELVTPTLSPVSRAAAAKGGPGLPMPKGKQGFFQRFAGS